MPEDPTMRAYFDSEWQAGRLTKPQNAMIDLLRNPESFLKKHPIINTFDCTVHGTTSAYFRNDRADAKRPGTKLKTKRFHTTESFNIESVTGANSYGHRVPVHGIYMGASNVAPVWYTLDATGPAMMLTAKLTGCTFVAKAAPGNGVQVTHLQPQGESGLQLNRRMRAPGQKAYGRLKYDLDKRSINVMGVRQGGRWRIWAQKLVKNSHTPQVLSVKKIWPA